MPDTIEKISETTFKVTKSVSEDIDYQNVIDRIAMYDKQILLLQSEKAELVKLKAELDKLN